MTRLLGIVLTSILTFAVAVPAPAAHADPRPTRAQLNQARIDAAAHAYAVAEASWRVGRTPLDEVYTWSVRWLDAQRDQPVRGRALTAALADHLTRMTDLAAEVDRRVKAGSATQADAAATAYYVAEAALWAARRR
jgi:hypothetical protein